MLLGDTERDATTERKMSGVGGGEKGRLKEEINKQVQTEKKIN